MDSPEPTNPPPVKTASAWRPLTAFFHYEFQQSFRHWSVIAWAILAAGLGVLWFLTPAKSASSVAEFSNVSVAAQVVSRLVGGHILFWAAFALALGASGLSGDRQIAADSFLSRGLSRLGYFFSKALARLVVAWALMIFLIVPLAFLAHGTLPGGISVTGLISALLLTGGILSCLILLGHAAGIWFENPLVCVATCCMVVYGLGVIVSLLQLQAVAPTALIHQLSRSIHGQTGLEDVSLLLPVLAGITLLVTVFSLWRFSHQDV